MRKHEPTAEEKKLLKRRDKLLITLAVALHDIDTGKIYPGSHAKKKKKNS